MIRDQHNGYAVGRLATVQDVETHWVDFLNRLSLEPVHDRRMVVAYINDSRWVADCPECNGGMICAASNPRACCLDCGHIYFVVWPDDAEIAEAALSLRPMPATRNWNAHRDEPVSGLLDENEKHLRSH